ncbi:ubiquitin carboxyl-terminal hydrolase 17-like protein 6 [Choloepus didactylus]|uniref:ubiquitin carboxyl-terminal hydrolase 17-like protein 6 n=1 Tax=Choloepus didactylus TaxID=27675 RepID=UPI00189CE93F|nr:ubiquitin carboxyl-terminal hydrolase 17-like protein 6 [Choloepus didactylus]
MISRQLTTWCCQASIKPGLRKDPGESPGGQGAGLATRVPSPMSINLGHTSWCGTFRVHLERFQAFLWEAPQPAGPTPALEAGSSMEFFSKMPGNSSARSAKAKCMPRTQTQPQRLCVCALMQVPHKPSGSGCSKESHCGEVLIGPCGDLEQPRPKPLPPTQCLQLIGGVHATTRGWGKPGERSWALQPPKSVICRTVPEGEASHWSSCSSHRSLATFLPRDMEAPSLLGGGESPFKLFPKPKLPPAPAAGVHVHRLPSPADKTLMSPQTHGDVQEGFAPVAVELPHAEELCLSWHRPHGIGAGLQNLGNSCYLNAALQCLTYTPPLASYLLSEKHCGSCVEQGLCITCTMSAHIRRALHHPGDVLKPSPALAMGFHTQRQEDAHEFLMLTLNAMQKAWLPGRGQLDQGSADTSPIRQIFGGYWRSQIKCLHCQAVSDTSDPYLDIALDIREAQSVSQALEVLVEPEELDGEDSYLCSSCEQKVRATKTLTLHTSPKALILVLKRFSDFTGDKISKHVRYPECLDMRKYMSETNGSPLVYGLHAVLVHSGSTCHTGHYLCYVKAGNGEWHKMDDAKVTACETTCVLKQEAYVLFYTQMEELHRDRESVMQGMETRHMRAQDAEESVTQAVTDSDSSLKVAENEGHWQERAAQEFSLEEWKILQGQKQLKPAFSLRKIESALPPNAFVIHRAKHRGQREENHREWETHSLNNPAGCIQPQVVADFGQTPCPGKGCRGSKKKNKKGKRVLDVLRWSQ